MDEIQRIIQTARENLAAGIIREPRVWWDEIALSNTISVGSTPDTFRNGEEYPVRISHLTFAMSYLDAAGEAYSTEEEVQRVACRLTAHGRDYMNRQFVVLPAWHNVLCAPPQASNQGMVAYRFTNPWVLSSRDAMRVRVELESTGRSGTTGITATFVGYGIDTGRQYRFSGRLAYGSSQSGVAHLVADEFRNDGDEAVVMVELGIHCSAQYNAQTPQGDIRPLRISVKQVGNGTQADWFAGAAAASELMPAQLLGTAHGRAIVHRFPPSDVDLGAGVYLEPGEGFQIEFNAPGANLSGSPRIAVAAIGTLEVI